MNTLNQKELKALEYAEKYGIIDYKITGNTMTYYESYPTEGHYKATVNLKTMVETRKQVKFIRKGGKN